TAVFSLARPRRFPRKLSIREPPNLQTSLSFPHTGTRMHATFSRPYILLRTILVMKRPDLAAEHAGPLSRDVRQSPESPRHVDWPADRAKPHVANAVHDFLGYWLVSGVSSPRPGRRSLVEKVPNGRRLVS